MYKIYWASVLSRSHAWPRQHSRINLGTARIQADCDAGVWVNPTQEMRNILELGDIEEALTAAAAAVGDDSGSTRHHRAGAFYPRQRRATQ